METATVGQRTVRVFFCCLLSALVPQTLFAAGPASAPNLQIVDAAGKPLPAAPFRVFAPPASKSLISDFGAKILEGQSDSVGRLPAPLPRLGGLLVVVDHPGFAPFVEEVMAPRNEIRLTAGSIAVGEVSGPSGPVRGRVCARWEVSVPTWSRTFPFERCGEIDVERRWAIPGLAPAPVRLTAEVAGFLPASASWKPGSKPLALTLEPGFLIAGRLLDPAGQAVREALLESTGAAPTGVDEKGSFGFALPALPATVRIRAPGFRTRQFDAPAKVPKEPLAIRLEWGQQIKGIVLDASGQPLTKAELQAYRWLPQTEGWTPESFELQPAADGSFEVDLPRPGEYRLRLRAEGLRSEPFPRQWITQGSVVDLGVVAFETGAGVRCRVVDEADGEPIAGVEARLVGRGTGLLAQLHDGGGKVGASDAQGEILMTGAEAGAYRLRLRHDRYAKTSRNLDLERGEIHDCGEVALAPAIEVSGRVLTRGGRPMPGARVRFFEPPADGFEPAAEAVADSDGRFEGARLSAAEYVVWVDRERRLLSQAYTLERPAKERKVEVDLVVPSVQLVVHLVRGGQPVEGGGWVTLTSELDLADARLKMQFQTSGDVGGRQMVGVPDRPQTAAVGEDGTAEIADAPAGPARLELIAPDGSSVARRVLVPDQALAELTVDLGGAALAGRLVDAGTEAGLAGLVEVVDDGGRTVASLTSDADGRFLGLDIAPGAYGLRATAKGYTPTIHKVVLPRDGEAPVVLALLPGGDGTLSVHFERPDGGPAAGLVAHLVDGAGRMIGACVADATGRCRHPRVPPGTYALAWSDPVTGAGGASTIVAKPDEETDFEHRLRSGGPLTLRCAQCAGATLEGLIVVTTSGVHVTPYLEGVAPAMRFGADGLLALGRLNAGTYLVRARVAGREKQQGIEVRPGESTDFDLDSPAPAPAPGARRKEQAMSNRRFLRVGLALLLFSIGAGSAAESSILLPTADGSSARAILNSPARMTIFFWPAAERCSTVEFGRHLLLFRAISGLRSEAETLATEIERARGLTRPVEPAAEAAKE